MVPYNQAMIQLYVRCMMKKLSKTLLMSPAVSLVLPASLFVSFNSAYASLVDTSQNQTFESRPQAAAISKRPVSSPFIKLAAVHFIANDGNLSFGNQEFLPEDICKQGGYTHKGCPAGYVKGEACPEDGSYVKDCIDPDTWCKNNGYEVTGCQVPQYPQGACPYGSGYYKSCETDNIRACKELGYSLTCEAGKVGDTNQSCPYNESYKKCVCNPCGGYGYTASEANAQGYTPGEVCNSCGTMKYKRSANACDGFKECTDGGAAGAEVCYSGSLKKFSECKDGCAEEGFIYTPKDCAAMGGDYIVDDSRGWCFGKYIGCKKGARILYGDGTVGMVTEVNINKEKTPIGFVINEDKHIAVALTNINEPGTLTDKKVKFASGINGEADLQRGVDYNVAKFSSGQENTKALLNVSSGSIMQAPFEAAELVRQYQPPACSQSFCSKGRWFLASKDEWLMMREKKEDILTSISELYGYVWTEDVGAYYGLKSEGYYKDAELIAKMNEDISGKSVSGLFEYTPFWLGQDNIHFSNGKWNFEAYTSDDSNLWNYNEYSFVNSVRAFVNY